MAAAIPIQPLSKLSVNETSSNEELPSSSKNTDKTENDWTNETAKEDDGPSILDYSYTENLEFKEALENNPSGVFSSVESILATNNNIMQVPDVLSLYTNLRLLDLSTNLISDLDALTQCKTLVTLLIRNNFLDENSFPKSMRKLTNLRELNLSGNRLTRIPDEVLKLQNIQTLHLGGNSIEFIDRDIGNLRNLEVLYLGGNAIRELPYEIGQLKQLRVLVLSDNRLECLPKSVSTLKQLKSLLLHRNRLTALPVELIKLRNLLELSLRDNPLVNKFVRDMIYDPPTLMELAGRTVKLKKVPYKHSDLPKNLIEYLSCAHQCVNPRCKGVFFDTRVEHIKFVDFCGKYRVPLLEYLCSPKCSDHRSPAHEASDSSDSDENRIRKVLLG